MLLKAVSSVLSPLHVSKRTVAICQSKKNGLAGAWLHIGLHTSTYVPLYEFLFLRACTRTDRDTVCLCVYSSVNQSVHDVGLDSFLCKMVTDLLIQAAGQSGQLVSLACVKIRGSEYASQNVLAIARFSSKGSDTWVRIGVTEI